jgi:hypothetical protein
MQVPATVRDGFINLGSPCPPHHIVQNKLGTSNYAFAQ